MNTYLDEAQWDAELEELASIALFGVKAGSVVSTRDYLAAYRAAYPECPLSDARIVGAFAKIAIGKTNVVAFDHR